LLEARNPLGQARSALNRLNAAIDQVASTSWGSTPRAHAKAFVCINCARGFMS
jgi:hypothetical protein